MWIEIKKAIAQWMIGKAFDMLPNSYFKNEFAKFINDNLKYL
ncbi:hypothetical protein [Tenacibaculum sp. 190524A05c]